MAKSDPKRVLYGDTNHKETSMTNNFYGQTINVNLVQNNAPQPATDAGRRSRWVELMTIVVGLVAKLWP